MSQHYTRNTLGAEAWCHRCKKQTEHVVHDRRIGPCLRCIERLNVEKKIRDEQKRLNPRLPFTA